MGFFSELKEDLSQAVNEMVSEEEKKKAVPAPAPEPEPEPEPKPEPKPVPKQEVVRPEKEKVEKVDLNELLESITSKDGKLNTVAPVKMDIVTIEPVRPTGVTNETAIITEGMSVLGDIASTGSLEVLGEVKGNISVNGKLNIVGAVEGDSSASEIYAENAKVFGEIKSNGSVKVGQSTVIIGNIYATSAVIAGAVKGDIDVKGPVILDSSAIVMGNIKSKSVQINNGAVIEGICSQCYADVSPSTFFDKFK